MTKGILQFLIGIGVLQSALLGLVLLMSSGKHKLISIILGAILLLASLLLLSELTDLLDMEKGYSFLRHYSVLFDLILIVLMWWLTLAVAGKMTRFFKKDVVHILPFAVGLIWLETGFQWYGNHTPGTFSHIPDAVGIFLVYKMAIWGLYVTGCLKVVSSERLPDSDLPQSVKKVLFHKLVWPFIGISLASFFSFWLMFFGMELPVDSDYLGAIMITVFVYYLTFSILREPHLFIHTKPTRLWPKYRKSKMSDGLDSDYLKKLVHYMESEKPYLDQKLSLHGLSETLQIPSNTVSRIINEQLGQSFNDMINTYRLQEVKQKLMDSSQDHKTILALAFESGFQSKASFNRVFKKMEGKTPSEYKESFRSHPTL